MGSMTYEEQKAKYPVAEYERRRYLKRQAKLKAQSLTVRQKYNAQKARAKQRGIVWLFTYISWSDWWGTDIDKRGRKSGQLCMARKNDEGPYSPSNCEKITHGQNTADGNRTRASRNKPSPGDERVC